MLKFHSAMLAVGVALVALLATSPAALAGSQVARPKYHDTSGHWGQCNVVGSTEPDSYFVRVRSNAECREGNIDPYDLGWTATCRYEDAFIGYSQLSPWAVENGARANGEARCFGQSFFQWVGPGLYTGVTRFRLDLNPAALYWDVGPNYTLSDPGYREITTGPNGKVMIITLWSRWSS
jgi:hypothetical protein